MEFLKKIKLNIIPIIKQTILLSGSIFSVLTIVLSFITWEDMKIENIWIKICILFGIILISFLVSLFFIVVILKNKKLWANGKNKVLAFYGDIFKITNKQEKKIVVIPVNDTFETIVDDDLVQDKPLVSLTTIHGQWIKYMNSKGIDSKTLSTMISDNLKNRKIEPIKIYTSEEKNRGNKKSYELGTIVTINGENNTTFYLIAISTFDEYNKANSSRKKIRNCVDELIEFYDTNGQGYQIFIPLFGTGRSRADLNHQQAFKIIKNAVLTNEKSIHGIINIVVYKKDKDKVSIFK